MFNALVVTPSSNRSVIEVTVLMGYSAPPKDTQLEPVPSSFKVARLPTTTEAVS
jgi:hypothetical protein